MDEQRELLQQQKLDAARERLIAKQREALDRFSDTLKENGTYEIEFGIQAAQAIYQFSGTQRLGHALRDIAHRADHQGHNESAAHRHGVDEFNDRQEEAALDRQIGLQEDNGIQEAETAIERERSGRLAAQAESLDRQRRQTGRYEQLEGNQPAAEAPKQEEADLHATPEPETTDERKTRERREEAVRLSRFVDSYRTAGAEMTNSHSTGRSRGR